MIAYIAFQKFFHRATSVWLLVFFLKKFSIKHCPRHQIIHPERKATGTVGHEQSCKATDKDSTQMYSPGVDFCKLWTHTHTCKGRSHKSGNMSHLTITCKHANSRENYQLSLCSMMALLHTEFVWGFCT